MAGTVIVPYDAAQRAEAEALLRETDLRKDEIAARTGVAYGTICRWNDYGGFRPVFRRSSAKRGIAPSQEALRAHANGAATLDAVLRAHVARQVAAIDLALRRSGSIQDSSRLLRDLVALKKLLDEIARASRAQGSGHDSEGEAHGRARGRADMSGDRPEDPLAGRDIAALRASVARRLEALAAGCDAPPGDPGRA